MYVCLCKGITDRQIRETVEQGASSFLEVQQQLGVASQCGRCANVARDVVDQALAKLADQLDYGLCYAVA